jgi:hypothetical protein
MGVPVLSGLECPVRVCAILITERKWNSVMLIEQNSNKVRFTAPEMARKRKAAAKHGYVINKVETLEDAMEATIKALPLRLAEDMLNFIEKYQEQEKN